jgi:hypothetical protein
MNLKFSTDLKKQFANFLENHPLQPFRGALCGLLFEYIREHCDGGFDTNFSRLLWSIEDLFDLLDQASSEILDQKKSQHWSESTHEKKAKNARKSKIARKR